MPRLSRVVLLILLALRGVGTVVVPSWHALRHAVAPQLSLRHPLLADAFSPRLGNLMFWKLHKVGGTSLRYALLRRVSARNLTLGVLGCRNQREPLLAHLSASHVVCQRRTRDAALAGLLGRSYAEATLVREPLDRALSAYYFVGMSARRTAAVNAACGGAFNITFMGRDFAGELPAERLAFAQHGLAALQRCSLSSRAGPAAHLRVFQPQWAYWARDVRSSAAHAERLASAGRFFVGRTEAFDETLVLLNHWLALPPGELRATSRKRAYGGARPQLRDWDEAAVRALSRTAEAAGETGWHASMLRIYDAQAAAYPGGAQALRRATEELRRLEDVPLSDAEREEERRWRRRRRKEGERSTHCVDSHAS